MVAYAHPRLDQRRSTPSLRGWSRSRKNKRDNAAAADSDVYMIANKSYVICNIGSFLYSSTFPISPAALAHRYYWALAIGYITTSSTSKSICRLYSYSCVFWLLNCSLTLPTTGHMARHFDSSAGYWVYIEWKSSHIYSWMEKIQLFITKANKGRCDGLSCDIIAIATYTRNTTTIQT